YAHWWSYTIDDLTLHLPLPFYISQVLIYGSVAYLLIWRFWHTRLHWLAWVLLVGVPVVGFLRDLVYNGLTTRGYAQWQSPLAGPVDFVMWLLLFYAGYFLFKRFVPTREIWLEEEAASEVPEGQAVIR
ncbi:MAG TPA: hypothetical protein VGN34_34075, partial [Ktedonobacteraceae bacterium]